MRSIPKIMINEKIVLDTICPNNLKKLKNENASIVKTIMQYKRTMDNKYLKYDAKPIDLIVTSPSEISSSRGTYSLKIFLLTKDMIVQAKACIPCVSENISTNNPVKNAIVRTILMFKVKGNLISKYMNIIGIAILNRHMLLQMTTCANIRTKNNIIKLIAVFPIS